MSRETVFTILSNRRRRYVLHYLKQRDAPVSIRELSETVAAWENGPDAETVTPKERKRVYTALHQSHLPKMDRAGVVRYDPDRGTVELTDAIDAFDIYLDVVPTSDLNWGEFYLGLGAIGTALGAVVWLEVFPFALLPPSGHLCLFGLTVLLVGVVHTYQRRRARVGDGDLPPELTPATDDAPRD